MQGIKERILLLATAFILEASGYLEEQEAECCVSFQC